MFDNIIVVPYRNRETHLRYYIEHTVPLLQTYLPNSKVVVVEQNEGKPFNRGAILNVAFKEYENKTKYFFTHDVDMNPSLKIVKDIYTKKEIEMMRVKFVHDTSLGGIIKVKHDVIFEINGFPNDLWGWGIEDRALYYRCLMKQINITNNPHQSFKLMPHIPNKIEYIGEKKKKSDLWRPSHIDKLDTKQKDEMIMRSGVNNLKYTIIERKMIHNFVEVIKVEI